MNKAYLVGAEVLDDSTQLRLERSIESIRDILASIAVNESSWLSIVATAFGNNFDVSGLEALRLYDLSLLPEIEIRLAAELNGANGAFAGATNRIYLALEFLEQNDSEKISAVVLEEIGHWLDFQLNAKDSPGDEGEIFSALVRGEDLDPSRLQVLKTENDTSNISLDGQVIEVEQANNDVTISGTIYWTDTQGNNHPVRFASLKVWDKSSTNTTPVKTGATDDRGNYLLAFNNNGHDFCIQILANGLFHKVQKQDGKIYSFDSQVFNISGGELSLPDFIVPGISDIGDIAGAFSISDAMSTANEYAIKVSQNLIDLFLPVIFPIVGDVSFYKDKKLNIISGEEFDWDVIFHEYGHALADLDRLAFIPLPGGDHTFGVSNITRPKPSRSKEEGIRVAWSEGLATYLGIAAQDVVRNLLPNVPNVGNEIYEDVNAGATKSTVDLEKSDATGNFVSGKNNKGEGDEASVMRILWDIADANQDPFASGLKSGAREFTIGDVQDCFPQTSLYGELLQKTDDTLAQIQKWNVFFSGNTTTTAALQASFASSTASSLANFLPLFDSEIFNNSNLQWISSLRESITEIKDDTFASSYEFISKINSKLEPFGLSLSLKSESLTKIEFQLNLERDFVLDNISLAADFGLPWLGLDVKGGVDLNFDFNFLDADNNSAGIVFGVEQDSEGNFDTFVNNNIKKLSLGLDTALSSDFAAQGKLGFVDINLAQDPNLPSNFGAEAIVDLDNLGNAPTFNFKPDNQLNFDLTTQFASNILPAISSDLKLDFGTSANLESVNFDNVKVDLGTFISPIAGKIQEVTSPIKPYVDVLDKDLKEVFDIGVVKDVLDVFDLNDDDKVNLVDFVYYYDPALGDSLKTFIDVFNSLASIGDGVPVGAIDLGSFSVDSSGNVASKTQAITAFAASGDGLHLPIIEDPFAAINLLLGKDVNLVTYELPKVNFDFTYEQSFPLIPPLEIVFGVGLGADIQFSGFGFDTYGLRRFADSDDLADILQGFYVSDRSFVDGTGEDVSEIGFNSRISLGGGVNLGIAKGGVNGYLSGELNFNLHDTNDDGKIRPYEFTLDPLELFDATAELNAGLNAYLKLDFGLFAKTLINEDIADTSLIDPISFNEKPFTPSLGSKNSNNILLHVGTHAKDRNVEKGIVDEVFQVGQLETTIELFAFNHQQQIFFPDLSLVNAIVANGDIGNDNLALLPGVTVAAQFQGGDGNDLLSGASSNDTLEGGTGEDLLISGQGDDFLRGEAGIDTLYGEDGNDVLEGNEDSDLLFGQVGNDNLAGGQGEDALYGYVGNDILAGGSENDLLVGEQDNDTLFGNAGVDNLYGGEGDDEIHGGDDADFLLGELGNDNLLGDAGVDTLYGGEGNDLLDGSAGDDELRGEAGNNTVKGGLGNDLLDVSGYSDRNELYGQEGDDILKGSLTNDLLDGGGDRDGLAGSEGDDELFGGDGNDRLFGEGGNDNLQGGLGEDLLLGGIGSDRGDGGEGKDTIYGGYDGDTLYGGSETDSLYGETGNDELHGGDGDESVVLGAEGNDRIYGDAGADTLDGGDGNDQIYGNNDNDSLIGGAGDDLLVGDDFNDLAFPDSSGNDRLEGGVGNDELFGYLGDDTLVGGEGDDYLAGGLGDDTVEGGAGKDVFVLAPDSDVDTIKDFSLTSPDLDVIFLSDGLSFDFISVTDEAIETVDENGNPITISRAAIRDRDTGDLLAIVENVAAKDLGRAAFDEENVAPDRLEFESKKPIYGQDEVVTLINTTVRDANGVNDLEIVDFWLQNPDGSWQNVRDVGWKGIDGSGIWGDYDKDDDLDLLIAGVNHNGLSYPIKIYRNNGDGSFSDLQLDLPQSFVNSLGIFWQDYDGDGDLDLLGYNYILNNRGDDTFTVSEILPNLAPTEDDSVLWGDFDGDGDSDVLLADTNSSKIYRNDGEDNFVVLQEDLTAVKDGIVAWGKDDNESYLLLTTEAIDSEGNPVSKTFLYNYDGTRFVLVFENLFPNIAPDSFNFADYNADGNLDLILTGAEGFILDSTNPKGIARIYRGDGTGNFIADEDTPQLKPANPTNESIYNPGFIDAATAWGDYDGDGDLDLLVTGGSNQFGLNGETRTIVRIPTTKLFSYQEEIGQFVEVETNLPELYHQTIGEHLSWQDYDKDGDRDLLVTGRDFFDNPLTKVYRNDGYGILGNGWKHSAPNLFILSGAAEKTDIFVLDNEAGIETITNFKDGKDLLYLTPDLLFGSIRFEANGNDTEIIKFSTGNIIAKIIGVKPEQLSNEDFIIVLDNPDAATITIDNFEIGKDFIYLRGGLNLSAIELQSEIQEDSENTKIVSKQTGKVLAQINNIAAETLSAGLDKYFVVEKINFVDAVFTPILSNSSDTRLATFEYKLEGLDPGNYVLKGTAYDHQIASEERVVVPATGEPYSTNTTFVTLQGNLPNLLGLYTFEDSVFPGSVEDLSGKGNYGVVSGATQIEAGFEGKAYQFDGVDDYIEIPFLNINPSLYPQVTIGAWVKADSLNINRNTIISHDDGGFDRGLTIDDRGGIPSFSAFSGTGQVLGSDSANLGDWIFVAAVYDQIAAIVTLYVNDRVFTETGVLGEGLPYLNVGRNPSFPSELFTGAIDNVFVYDDALSLERKLPPSQLTEALARATFSYFCSRLTGYNLSLCLTGACFEVIAPIF